MHLRRFDQITSTIYKFTKGKVYIEKSMELFVIKCLKNKNIRVKRLY